MREDDHGASVRRRDSRSRPGRGRPPRTRVTAPATPDVDTVDPTAPAGPVTVARPELVAAAVDGAWRGALVMFAGFAGTVALGLLLWAVNPSADLGAEPAVRAATAAYVLAHFGHVGIGGASLSLTPLLLTLVFAVLLGLGPGRGRIGAPSIAAEATSIAAGALTYAVLVVVAAVTLAPSGVAVFDAAIGALLVAAAALSLGMLRRGRALRGLLLERLPGWATAGAVAGGIAVLTVIAGAGAVFAVALVTSFGTASDLASTLADGAGDAVGLALAGLAYLPNAVLTTVGYVTGAGFSVGAGRWSPLGSVPADLPPFPLLAAVPSGSGVSVAGVVTLVVPLAAGLLAALAVLRRVPDRRDRWAAVATAAGVAGLALGILVWAASGGVSGGPWPQVGATGWQVGLISAAFVLVVAGAWVGAAARGAVTVADGPVTPVTPDASEDIVDDDEGATDDTTENRPEADDTAPDGDPTDADADMSADDTAVESGAGTDTETTDAAATEDPAHPHPEEAGADRCSDADAADDDPDAGTTDPDTIDSGSDPAESESESESADPDADDPEVDDTAPDRPAPPPADR